MKRRLLLLGLAGLVVVLVMVSGGSAASPPAAVWGKAIEVPGSAALNSGGNAEAESVSCAAAGDCAAGGYYKDGSAHYQAFVVNETHGRWGTAVEVPGSATLNSGGDARVESVSCVAAGDCAAGGYYDDGSGNYQVFVVSETYGVWGIAVEVPGSAALNSGGDARVLSVSCAAAGECAGGGYYKDGSGHYQAFVVDETHGVWGTAIEVPGSAALNSGGDAAVNSVSCSAAGDCTAGGAVDDSSKIQAFVASETNGVWGTAVEVPGSAALNSGGEAAVNSVSCSAAGECAAGGSYTDGSSELQAFVASETHGVWGTAVEVPGDATLNNGGLAGVNSVSCASAGDCAAGGFYTDGASHNQAFVVSETHGVWGTAIEVPGSATLNSGAFASVNSVSCAAPGDCAAGGHYSDGSSHNQAFVVNSTSPCVVPKVIGKTLSAAKKALTAASCSVGKIRTVYAKAKRGRVVAQHPKPGTHLKHGGKVALTVSKGKK